MTRSDVAVSSPESHPTAVKGEGSAKVGLNIKHGTSYSALAIRDDITATVHIPPQLPLPSPVVDVVTDGPSTCSLGTERTLFL